MKSTLQNQRAHLGEKGEKVLDACVEAIEKGCADAPGEVTLSTNGHISQDGSGSFGISASLNGPGVPQSPR